MPTLYTIGHSTREIAEFIHALGSHGVQLLVDVRTVPRSRHVPQYNSDALAAALSDAGVAYWHMKALGGFRRPQADSPNMGWRNKSFRGYADYMQTDEFSSALAELITLAEERPTAIMCAEAVPFRCHRSLIADALVARGFRVLHIMGASRADEHHLTPFAKVEGDRVTYLASA